MNELDAFPAHSAFVSFIEKLTLNNFRNYMQAQLTTNAQMNILIGENGSGKTNILEAISLLSPGRGLRRAPYSDLSREGSDCAWVVNILLKRMNKHSQDDDLPHDRIGTLWSPGSTSRLVRINSEDRSNDDLSEYLRLLWLTPSMDGLFMGASSDRRRFLDRLVLILDGGHGTRVNAFDKVMRQRNRLLEDMRADIQWLSALEQQMAELASAIILARLECVSLLNSWMQERKDTSAFPWASLHVEGDLEAHLTSFVASELEDEYMRLLEHNRPMDRQAGRTLFGPHRSDFIVTHGPKQMQARKSSTGEQKALLISLILAHAYLVKKTVNHVPILLLDEITAHLDDIRREALFENLAALGAQVWLTGTDIHDFEHYRDEAQCFTIENHDILAIDGFDRL